MLPFVGESVFAYGVLYVENAPLQPEGTAIAFGDVVFVGSRGELIGPVQAGVTSAAHELMHVLQGRIFGPLYPPLNATHSAGRKLRGNFGARTEFSENFGTRTEIRGHRG